MKLRLFVLFFSLLITFQNCSQVRIERIESPSVVSLAKPTNSLCAPVGSSFTSQVRFIFIIDMSMSNVGTLVTKSFNNKNSYYIDKTDGPSDLNGDRFLHVKKFISECGGKSNTGYSIIGFSENTIMVNDTSCVSPFEPFDKALTSLEALKGLQDHDLAIAGRDEQNPFYLQGETFYNVGLSCLKSKITEEVNLLKDQKPIYNVFFITDGLTTDKIENQNYKQILSEIQLLTSTSAGGFNFYPVYYTSPGAKNQGAQQVSAIAMLDSMAKAVNPTQKTLLLNNIATKDNQFCQFVQPEVRINYELKKLYAVNITSTTKGSSLSPDSDADGLSDDEEVGLGWDPLNNRSTSIIDSLCLRYSSDKSSCLTERSKLTCDPSINILGLNECDLKFSSNIFGSNMSYVDKDSDFIPDFIELVKNSNPIRFDSSDIPFSDGYDNLLKVELGLDLKSNNLLSPFPDSKKINIDFFENLQQCQSNAQSYQYILNNIPLQKVQPFNEGLTNNNNFYHEQNENVILIISYWHSTGGIVLPDKIYTQIVKVKIDNSEFKVGDLIFLGDLQ